MKFNELTIFSKVKNNLIDYTAHDEVLIINHEDYKPLSFYLTCLDWDYLNKTSAAELLVAKEYSEHLLNFKKYYFSNDGGAIYLKLSIEQSSIDDLYSLEKNYRYDWEKLKFLSVIHILDKIKYDELNIVYFVLSKILLQNKNDIKSLIRIIT